MDRITLVELIEGETAKLSPRGRDLWEDSLSGPARTYLCRGRYHPAAPVFLAVGPRPSVPGAVPGTALGAAVCGFDNRSGSDIARSFPVVPFTLMVAVFVTTVLHLLLWWVLP